jgi:3-dehydroquinate synthase
LDGTASNSAVYVQRVAVRFEYPVYFTRGLLEPSSHVLLDALCRLEQRRHRALCVIDDGVAAAWPDLTRDLEQYARVHADRLELLGVQIIAGGERVKNTPEHVERLQADLHRLGVDRQSFVIAIGGGAMLDAVGYAAATTHRGVRIIRVPTTVLSQNDSGVGVKNGINAFGAKNFLGTFAPPFAVINDGDFLRTLDARDQRAGMAEAIKVALIRDVRFFDWLEENVGALAAFEPNAMAAQIRWAAEIHLRHIASAGDPFETGSARPLDYGHWAAHKLEGLTHHALRHGEAVAIGMALDCRYSLEAGLIGKPDCDRILALLKNLGFALWSDALDELGADGEPAVLGGLRDFQEHLGGELSVTLLTGIGTRVEAHEMDAKLIKRSIDFLRQDARQTAHTMRPSPDHNAA